MKKFSWVMFVVLFGLAMTFIGCKKDVETSDLVLDDFQTGEVTCKVGAIFSSDDTKLVAVPSGTKVVFEADYSLFGGNSSGKLSQTGSVDSKGEVTVNLKTTDDGVTYNIRVIGFKRPYKVSSDNSEQRFWELEAEVTVPVKPNSKSFKVIKCTGTKIDF